MNKSESELLGLLGVSYANRGYTRLFSDQTLTWEHDLQALRSTLAECLARNSVASSWGVLLEFSIPRKEKRIDTVLLVGGTIVVLEAKSQSGGAEARRQLEEYALLLHYFHHASSNCRIVPILVSQALLEPDWDALNQGELFSQLPAYWIAPVIQCSWDYLPNVLLDVAKDLDSKQDVQDWDGSPYRPVPSIIEAALALKSGLSIREIAQHEASEHEIGAVRDFIQAIVNEARYLRRHAICFLTGVPGSGKTLVGLGLAHSDENKENTIHFMSGNGPLVKVLQHLFTREAMRSGASAPAARTHAKTLIENVHVFARYYTDDNLSAPANHAIIFDEAQRAWNRAQNAKKFKRDYSEPEMLLKVMGRHEDWAVVIALVGGGQEINDGEAGLEEWGKALTASETPWTVYASPEVLNGGPSTAGHKLFADSRPQQSVVTSTTLHLRTSNRSLRAEKLASWVNAVLEGDSERASALEVTARFPIFLSRDLEQTRLQLTRQRIGISRCGLVGSSGAARLRAEGLEPSSSFHAEYPWEYWYLADQDDVRSSYRCEVFATEFEIQGLELDWVGLCWGGDMIWSDARDSWELRALRHGPSTKWTAIKNSDRRIYRRNAYRVLLTRARQGMVLFVPRGDASDPTNLPEQFDQTAAYLLRCGVIPI